MSEQVKKTSYKVVKGLSVMSGKMYNKSVTYELEVRVDNDGVYEVDLVRDYVSKDGTKGTALVFSLSQDEIPTFAKKLQKAYDVLVKKPAAAAAKTPEEKAELSGLDAIFEQNAKIVEGLTNLNKRLVAVERKAKTSTKK